MLSMTSEDRTIGRSERLTLRERLASNTISMTDKTDVLTKQ
jgi:hypothetical protein